jgi:hypothetical protein
MLIFNLSLSPAYDWFIDNLLPAEYMTTCQLIPLERPFIIHRTSPPAAAVEPTRTSFHCHDNATRALA